MTKGYKQLTTFPRKRRIPWYKSLNLWLAFILMFPAMCFFYLEINHDTSLAWPEASYGQNKPRIYQDLSQITARRYRGYPVAKGSKEAERLLRESIFFTESASTLKYDDPIIVKYIQTNHLFPPNPVTPPIFRQPRGMRRMRLRNLTIMETTASPLKETAHGAALLALLGNAKEGIFVEAGAQDGILGSTTLVLEKKFGWTGILIESNPTTFGQLQNMSRNVWLSDVCLSEKAEMVKSMPRKKRRQIPGYPHLKLGVDPCSKGYNSAKGPGAPGDVKILPCFPLGSILAAWNRTQKVDYLRLDLDVAELEVVRAYPWSTYGVRVLSIGVDSNPCELDQDQKLRAFLREKGYHLVEIVAGEGNNDYIFVQSSVLVVTPRA